MKQEQIEFLVQLEKENRLKPTEVEKEARDENCPIHNLFEWDDEKAGYNFRLWQARKLIVRVKVVHEGREIQQFHNIKVLTGEEMDQRYISVETILSEDKMYEQLLKECRMEFMYWRNKYSTLKELKKNHKLLDELEGKLL